VHLTDWPDARELPHDPDLVAVMDYVREVCSAAHAIRKANNVRARHPLQRLAVASPRAHDLEPYRELITDEVNVKELALSADVAGVADEVLSVVPAALGPRLGPATQQVIAAVKRGEWSRSPDGAIEVAGTRLLDGEYTLVLRPVDERRSRTLSGNTGVITLETEVTEELGQEGLARDIVRQVQRHRKETGLHVADRIRLHLTAPADVIAAVERHRAYVAEQTLALAVHLTVGDEVTIEITKQSEDQSR
jgi:isoleucyl-tRNA synthetase